ncbi:TetR/AcrR family transcriptional regulator [Enterococcus sp. HMSC064A12]|uniref:TetR/AcrR family transcriptional regulator n=1 Tax=Enterococcus sp. HMSC064A12 TaxID=1715019 RepID=UPI00210C8A0B|nr:TetR family transcriptional regulator [Enterococcus sp. HMSC064A12]
MKNSRLTREIVIDCAMSLVHESGLHGLRLNKIAEHLEVKSPSLYTHTGSITELRQAVVKRAMEEFREELVDSLLGRANLYAFIELGKTWAAYAKKTMLFILFFMKKIT